jgi:hypothetical protein
MGAYLGVTQVLPRVEPLPMADNENDLVTKFFQVFHEYTNYYHTFCASR